MQEPAASVGYRALCKQAQKWLGRLTENVVRALEAGDCEAIHDLRVASRRLTEPLELVESLAGRKAVRRAQKGLKEIRKAFDRLRDIDVLRHSLHGSDKTVALDENALADLEDELESRRTEALDECREDCADIKPERTAQQVESLVEEVRRRDGDGANELRGPLQAMLNDRIQTLVDAGPANEGADLHEARIACKRLRYCAELFSKMDAEWDASLIETLADFQKLLGDWNDHVVAAQWVCKIASKRKHMGRKTEWASRLLDYAAARARAAGELRREIVARWPDLEKKVQAARGAREQPAAANEPATVADAPAV